MSAADEPKLAGIGIVGCGVVAREHHLAAIAAAGGSVAAVADLDAAAAARLAAAAGGVSAHDSVAALLDNPAVEVVAVCTPPETHREIAVAALESGRDVLIEKPMALTLEDAEAIIAARDRNGRTAAVGFNLRCHPLIAAAADALAAGELGEPIALAHSWVGPSHTGATGRAPGPGGGDVLAWDRGSHCFDLIRFLNAAAGGREYEAVTATGSAAGPITATLSGPGPLGTVSMAVAPGASNTVLCSGREASLEIDLYAFDGMRTISGAVAPGALSTRLRDGLAAPTRLAAALRAARAGGVFRAAYTEEWRAFASARRGDPPRGFASLEDGQAAAALAIATIRSAETGVTVERVGADNAEERIA